MFGTKDSRKLQVCLIVGTVLLLGACSKEPAGGGPLQMRRLTEAQYHQIVSDVFGEGLQVVGRFESQTRTNGLLAIGDSGASITEAGMEQFYSMSRNVAAQAVNEENRALNVGCEPADATSADVACAARFLGRVGRLLMRRSLSEPEIQDWVARSVEATETTGDFYDGLAMALTGMLVSPEFLFRIDGLEPDSIDAVDPQMDGYSKATRLSFLLWNTTPDDELLGAAENGDLHTEEGLAAQVDRMMASPRLETGARAFFRDFLGMELFENLQKDKLIYPVFDQHVSLSAAEQVLRFVINHVLTTDQDYRTLFTSRDTFMNRPLGMVYAVPVKSRDGWEAFSFPEDDARVGLLSHVGFTALHSHRGRSSPTLRGIAIREHLMCQPVAPAPAAVNFTVVQDTNHPIFKTTRERLTEHRTEPVCAGCHEFYDPIGLALENFDGAGVFRTTENGEVIDTSGVMDGVEFQDVADLGKALHDSSAVPSCLVNSVYKYAVGRDVDRSERAWVKEQEEAFVDEGYRLKNLLRRIATSETFYSIRMGEKAQDTPGMASNTTIKREDSL